MSETDRADRELWEQQPGESPVAYQAFVHYRDAGPRRSIRATGRDTGRAFSTVEQWATLTDWHGRARAWDAEVDRQARDAAISEVRAMAARHARQAAAAQDAAMQPVLAILEAARSDPDFRTRLVAEGLGKTLDAALSAAAKLPGLQGAERLARGEPTEITQAQVVAAASPEDLAATLEALRRAGVPIVADEGDADDGDDD